MTFRLRYDLVQSSDYFSLWFALVDLRVYVDSLGGSRGCYESKTVPYHSEGRYYRV